ncbi:helix-turn-helix transcriptional regulator [Salmonella enterica]|nr:helix-turn-helix transcriptional regulator [Salmonella enterica]EJB9437529.1 helix-turn-helix transcriptional regulator [Salmonella enterica]EJC5186576.1 helix-turn-helix transcriptional regulator [Salmonella enterica]EJF1288485.1 helix-turn-helix transcriptional regulator [Salmonella enterica]EJI2368730.1 helix-turn-helix transcriptional regulator [Salmonella enterica]
MPVVITYRRDWFRIIEDISRSGITLRDMADDLGVAKSTLAGWKQGAEPAHHNGEVLLDFWCHVTGRGRDEAPSQIASRRFVRSTTPPGNPATNGKLLRPRCSLLVGCPHAQR